MNDKVEQAMLSQYDTMMAQLRATIAPKVIPEHLDYFDNAVGVVREKAGLLLRERMAKFVADFERDLAVMLEAELGFVTKH